MVPDLNRAALPAPERSDGCAVSPTPMAPYEGRKGDNEPAPSAILIQPADVVLDQTGDLLIADEKNLRVRKVDTESGIITSIAGNGEFFKVEDDNQVTFGDDGPATEASVGTPIGLAFDSKENLLIVDSFWDRVRQVDAETGVIVTVAGGGLPSADLGDGGPASQAFLLEPSAIALDTSDNIFIVDTFNNRLRRVDSITSMISTVAGGGNPPDGLGDGGPATQAALDFPNGAAVDEDGNLYIADSSHNRVRRVDAVTGIITTVAGNGDLITIDPDGGLVFAGGDGGPATSPALPSPLGVLLDVDGNLYVSTSNNRIRRVDALTQIVTTVVGTGDIGALGDNGPALDASLSLPFGMALDVLGNLYIADRFNNRIRAVRGPLD